jgi:hypothetical protein
MLNAATTDQPAAVTDAAEMLRRCDAFHVGVPKS